MALSIQEIAAQLGGEVRGDADVTIDQVAPLERANGREIGFVAHPKYLKALQATSAAAVIVPLALADSTDLPRIVVRDPYLYFAQVAQLLNPVVSPYRGVHPSAVVQSTLPASAAVAPLAFIGEDCEIGENVVIGPGCMIERGSSIGEGTLFHANVVVYADSSIGARCILHAGCEIGSDGFGFAPRRDGSWEKIPQIGRVLIGDDVEVGANCTIDRGALDDTVIESGVKLDNMVHIAHNCRIGENSAIAGQSGMAGSSTIGKRVRIGGQSGILGHIEVCDDVVLSGRSLISKSVSEKGVYTSTIASQPHQEWLRNTVHLRHLDEMANRLRALEKKMKELESKA
ncbi:UDP-3-O-(3-hydroxymyristoyl)glucosamine N-acyltransferase [Uliginosibacterium flavum]|uniref:UDP-3-O-acylglucosamine N-acyltransferase n=1 Tax=Uliginosibacterium flavum TaxID=1396831 RepID=A0ABV2TM30_9RHOO